MVRFSVNPTPKQGSSQEPFAAQLALARVHSCLVPLERAPVGYSIAGEATRGWFELRARRGLAGYGLARALRMLLDVLAGLSALEATRTNAGEQFVHGELVPAMLRVDALGTTRLIPLAPRHWSTLGTLPVSDRCGHLAPERLLGDAIDVRADVFSAGVLLWEALAGRRLFETDSVDSIVMRLMGDKVNLPQLPPELGWALPLKAVAMCALSVDPEQRFANSAELAEAIVAVAGEHLATHADVADYFGTPDPVTRPVFARPPGFPTHLSSLSALVAPVQQLTPAGPSPSESISHESAGRAPRASRSVWAIAAISCVISALGASAITRYRAARDETHSAARSAPLRGEPMPSAAALPSALPVLSAAPTSVEPVPTAVEPAVPPTDKHEQASKAQKPANVVKSPAPKLKVPARAARSPYVAAAKYGI